MPKILQTTKKTSGGGGAVSDEPYGASWNGVAAIAPSKNAVYDRIQLIGYVPGNIAYVNGTGGDDSTAVLGNSLRPFKTIGAAVTALGTLANSAMFVFAGQYTLTDADAPFGLKMPGSQYDINLSAGVRIDYYGSYGACISDTSCTGSIYGQGKVYSYSATFSGAVDGVTNASFNIGINSSPKYFEFDTISAESTTATANAIRVGTCTSTGASFNCSGRIQSRGGIPFLADTGSRVTFKDLAYLVAAAVSSPMLKIVNVVEFTLSNLRNSAVYGQAFGSNQLVGIDITDTVGTSIIKFLNCDIIAVNTTDATFKLINITPPASGLMPNLLFRSCNLKNRQSAANVNSGYSISSTAAVSLKIQDVYADKNSDATFAITNLLSAGLGFMYEPNL